MSTAVVLEQEQEQDTVALKARNASLRLILEPNTDVYDGPMGQRRTIKVGKKLQFRNGRVLCPKEWLPLVKETQDYKLGAVIVEGEARLPTLNAGPVVTSGQAHTPTKAVEPPLPGWDDMPPRELRQRILANQVYDLEGAILWEMRHKGRGQVLSAIAQANKGEGAAFDDGPTLPDTAEPVIRPLPPGVE